MGKGRDDRGRAKEHRPGLRRSLWNYDPWGDAWALAPCTQGWRRHCQRIETSTEERENKLPTSNLHPMPATSTARGHPPLRERKTTGPHLPNPEPSLGTAERGGGEEGQSTCHQPGTPARWGLPHPQKAPGSLPQCQVSPATRSLCPQSHTSGEKGKCWPSCEDSRKNQKSEGSNLSSATLGDLRRVT